MEKTMKKLPNKRLLTLARISYVIFAIMSCSHAPNNRGDMDIQNDNELNLFELMSFGKANRANAASQVYTSKELYDDFDFHKLMFSKESKNSKPTFEVFIGQNRDIVRLIRRSTFPNSSLEFNFIREPKSNAVIIYSKLLNDNKENTDDEDVDGFFILQHGNMYFVGLSNHPFTLMELDAKMNAVRTLRFCSNEVIYKTAVNYHGNWNLYSERFYEPTKKFLLNEATTLGDIREIFENDDFFSYERETKIGWVEEQRYLPLWIMGGIHEYDVAATPLPKGLPQWKLASNCWPTP